MPTEYDLRFWLQMQLIWAKSFITRKIHWMQLI